MKSDKDNKRFRSGKAEENGIIDLKRQMNPAKVTGTMIGRIVQSTAGRDKDRYFVIVGEVDETHVTIADGRLRRTDRPKKKKIRHCRLVSFAGMECVEKIADGTCNDSYVRRVISAYRGETLTEKPLDSDEERSDSSGKG